MDKTRPVEVELLKRAEKVMREVLKDEKQAAKFNMDTWGNVTSKRPTLKCTTAACALGSLTLSKQFPGLKAEISSDLITEKWSNREQRYVQFKKPYYYIDIIYKDRDGENWYEEEAGAKYFNIPMASACQLFWPNKYENGTGPEAIKEFLTKLKDVISDSILFNKNLARKAPPYKTRGFQNLVYTDFSD